jgi:PPM family protein phosphatase
MTLRTFALTNIGLVRPENEDSFLCEDTLNLYAVADGIGGLPGGAQASQTTLALLADRFWRHKADGAFDYAASLAEINEKVHGLGRIISPRIGIGTTLTYAHFEEDRMVVVHVGDTVMFRLRGTQMESLTQEHNVENEMRLRASRGEPVMLITENRAALTRCVGQPPPLEGDIHAHLVESGDRYLLLTDGITRYVAAEELTRLLGRSLMPEDICRRLIGLANSRGGIDNSTAVAMFVE